MKQIGLNFLGEVARCGELGTRGRELRAIGRETHDDSAGGCFGFRHQIGQLLFTHQQVGSVSDDLCAGHEVELVLRHDGAVAGHIGGAGGQGGEQDRAAKAQRDPGMAARNRYVEGTGVMEAGTSVLGVYTGYETNFLTQCLLTAGSSGCGELMFQKIPS